MLIQALKGLKLSGFKVGLGNIAFVKSLLEGLGNEGSELKKYLSQKNMVAADGILSSSKASAAKKLKRILGLRGEAALKEVRKIALNEKERKALEELSYVVNQLKKLGLGEYLFTYDFSLVPDFDYYTGMVFEVYIEGIGLPVASGGRYDNLLASFGFSNPAAGFAFSLERLHEAIVRQGGA